MAEAPATSARNEPVPSSDGKQRLLFSRIFCVLMFLCSRLAQLWVHCSCEWREKSNPQKTDLASVQTQHLLKIWPHETTEYS